MEPELIYIIIILCLFVLVLLSFFMGKSLGKRYMFEVMQRVIEEERKDAIKKSRSVLNGQFTEQIAPFLPGFPVDASECRFMGKPIDFIAFRGLNEQEITEVVFIEIKTGKSQLNKTERSLKEAIRNKRVRFEEFRINNGS